MPMEPGVVTWFDDACGSVLGLLVALAINHHENLSMANVYVACWSMSETVWAGATTSDRVDALNSMVMIADTQLKIMGNTAGGPYTRILVAPEYLYTAGGTTLLSRSAKHGIYKRLEIISALFPDLVIIAGTLAYKKSKKTYGVCPILFGGNIVKKLYKLSDDGTGAVHGAFATKTGSGKDVPVGTVAGISIGLDICLDYSQNRLGNYLAANNVAPPDIHVQISGTNMTSASCARARNGGVYVHCDLGGKGTKGASAYRVTGHANGATQTTPIPPTQMMAVARGRLMSFDTPI
jgi:hypothetical protein